MMRGERGPADLRQGATPIIVTGSGGSFITLLPRLSTDAAVATDSYDGLVPACFILQWKLRVVPLWSRRQPYLLWVWQARRPVHCLSQENNSMREWTRNVMSAAVTNLWYSMF